MHERALAAASVVLAARAPPGIAVSTACRENVAELRNVNQRRKT
jgi:hypothetical protein